MKNIFIALLELVLAALVIAELLDASESIDPSIIQPEPGVRPPINPRESA